MKRIVIDARIINTSTGRYVERLLHYLQQIDSHNQYIVLMLKKDIDYWRPSAPNFKVVVANFPIYSLGEQLQFAFQLYRLNADLVHFTMPNHPLFYIKKHVITVHDLTLVAHVNHRQESWAKDLFTNHLKPAAFRVVMSASVHLARHIITPTHYVLQQIQQRYHVDASHLTYTHEAAEKLVAQSTPLHPPIKTPFLLYVGNAYPYKNLARLIDAASEVSRSQPITLILAGKPDYFYDQLKTYATKTHAGNVRFVGFVSDAELAWLYQHATLYVFPSLSEGFGLPPLEAMTYGLPVAAAKASCLPEVLQDAAVYFDPLDTHSMSRVIAGALGDERKLKRLKKAGLAHSKLFSWRRMAKQTLAVYTKALD